MSIRALSPSSIAARPPNPTPALAQNRRWPLHFISACLVFIAIAALLAATARSSFVSATPVSVLPALMPPAPQPVQSAADPAPRRSTATVQAPGWLEAQPFYTACPALADGVVAEILAFEGDSVEAGQVVARLVADDAALALARADAELAAAEASLISAGAELIAAQADWDNPVERDRAVSSTAAALAEAQAELARLPALVLEQEAILQRMREELRRAKRALEHQAATDIEVLVLEKQADAQAAATDALRSMDPVLAARVSRLAGDAHAASQDARLRIAERRTLDMATAAAQQARASVALATAARDEARLRLDRMEVRAPISGFVQRRLRVPGDKVLLSMDDPHSNHIVHIYDPSRLQVRVDVPLADAANIFDGQRCQVVVDVLPDRVFSGRVLRITHEADIQKNTLQVKVQVNEPSPVLRPEMLARVKFLPDASDGASAAGPGSVDTVLVHGDCIDGRDGRDASRVWVVRERRGNLGVAHPLPVVVRTTDSPWLRVESHLRPGDLLVANPSGLAPGQRVRMSAPGDQS